MYLANAWWFYFQFDILWQIYRFKYRICIIRILFVILDGYLFVYLLSEYTYPSDSQLVYGYVDQLCYITVVEGFILEYT